MFTNSFVNLIQGNASSPEPQLGMGATLLGYTDRHPATIVSVLRNEKGKVVAVEIQQDNFKRTDSNGMSEMQSYEFWPDPTAPRVIYTLRKNGRFVLRHTGMNDGERLLIGTRQKYHDYSF